MVFLYAFTNEHSRMIGYMALEWQGQQRGTVECRREKRLTKLPDILQNRKVQANEIGLELHRLPIPGQRVH